MELPSQLTIEMGDGSSVSLGEELTLPSNGSLTRGLAVSPVEGSCVVEHLSYQQEKWRGGAGAAALGWDGKRQQCPQ